jgi:uncharacterized membrane protein
MLGLLLALLPIQVAADTAGHDTVFYGGKLVRFHAKEKPGTLPTFLSDVKARHDKMVELVERMLKLHVKNRMLMAFGLLVGRDSSTSVGMTLPLASLSPLRHYPFPLRTSYVILDPCSTIVGC